MKHIKIGELGEDIACKYLEKKGFRILDRNYRKKWGELDIVAQKGNIYHFVEVKALTVSPAFASSFGRAQYETPYNNKLYTGQTPHQYKPEDAVQPWKIKRLQRAIQSYLLQKRLYETVDWLFDIIAVEIEFQNRNAKVRFIEGIML